MLNEVACFIPLAGIPIGMFWYLLERFLDSRTENRASALETKENDIETTI
jgi:hypothetical protein